eukprot:Hpha_TRINITY_DN9795_c0_g1::TRINITY_DN9795_c0_g1_i1::g.10269::m.10269/K01874/MARS, metG; methionyl-tRNA synthetase
MAPKQNKPGGKGAPPPPPFKPLPVPPVETLIGSKDLLKGDEARGKFYITTAINYTNGAPHIGHAYEALTTDIIARFHRLAGKRTYFLTGTDEHGQKIAQAAEAQGLTPKQLCDKYVAQFQSLNKRMSISNDGYIRTTDQHHEDHCRALWERCAKNDDIYLDVYEGWYNTREECFVPDAEAKANDFKDPETHKPYEKMREESYFFRLSKYQIWLKDHIEKNLEFVQPDSARQSILDFLAEPLRDLCVSRTTFAWGVKMPKGFDEKHVMYVWFDALTNYVSGTGLLLDPKNPLADLWPAECHIIGKDISRFHCVYWPCMLKSGGLPLPKAVYSHGHILAGDGTKMSKSLGNVVDPNKMLDLFPADTFRFYLCNEGNFGADLKFSVKSLVNMHNACLADDLGNLANRAVALCAKFCCDVGEDGKPKGPGKIPTPAQLTPPVPLPFDIKQTWETQQKCMAEYNLKGACDAAREATRGLNKWITEQAPWAMKEDPPRRAEVVRLALEAIYALALFFAPFHPVASTAVLKKLSAPVVVLPDIRPTFDNLKPGTPVELGPWEGCGATLFPKLEAPEEEEKPAAPKPAAKPGKAAAAAARTPAPSLPAAPTYPPKKPRVVEYSDSAFRFQMS